MRPEAEGSLWQSVLSVGLPGRLLGHLGMRTLGLGVPAD